MKTIRRLRKYTLTILLFWNIPQPSQALEHPNHHVGFYIKNFGGRVDPETLPHVYDVFTKVRSIAEVNHRDLPQLVIMEYLPGPPAFVLPDGNLILTQKALDVIYKDATNQEEGNTRLAFVLGHELAHLANDDFWGIEVKQLIESRALSGEVNDSILKQIKRNLDKIKENELKADDKGFLYAAMAGFPIEVLLEPENDFLSYWVAETNTQFSETHPEAIERTKLLRIRLQEKIDALEFFYMGVRLAHFGRYQDAVYFFREFRRVFPGREVFNNLGVCYLQMAVRKMPPSFAYQYWLPRILDNKTIIDRLHVLPVFRDRKQIEIAKDFLKQSVSHLEIAIKKDPAYRIGYINLAVAYFYLDQIYKARAAIEEARRLQSDDYEVESLRALIISKEGQRIDTWPYAEEIFSDLASDHSQEPLPPSFYYNWARLLEDRGRSAEIQLQKLTKYINELPWPIAHMLCERLKNASAREECLETINKSAVEDKPAPAFPTPLPIQPGFETFQFARAGHPLHDWQQLPFNWQGEGINSGIIYRNPQQGKAVLEMDGIVEMVVLRKKLGSLKQFLQENGPPKHKQKIMNGELWSYGHWCILIEQDQIKEFWGTRAPL